MVEKAGIRNKVAILDSRDQVWAGLRVERASEVKQTQMFKGVTTLGKTRSD